MDCLVQEVKEDLKDIGKEVSEIKITLAVNTQSLTEHMRRCDLLEESLESTRRFQYMFLGGMGVATFVAPFIVQILFNK